MQKNFFGKSCTRSFKHPILRPMSIGRETAEKTFRGPKSRNFVRITPPRDQCFKLLTIVRLIQDTAQNSNNNIRLKINVSQKFRKRNQPFTVANYYSCLIGNVF